MGNSPVEPKKHSRKIYYGFVLVAFLISMFVVSFFEFQNPAQDPLLYNDAVTVQALTDKTLYMKGEDVSIIQETSWVAIGVNFFSLKFDRINTQNLISANSYHFLLGEMSLNGSV